MDDMEAIYQQHAQTVYRFLMAQCHDAALAEELTQETFYQAVRSIHRFDGSCKISVWLCQIARHMWYQHLRRHQREIPVPDEELDGPDPASAEQQVLAQEGQTALLRRIHALPDPAREVVYLRAFGGLSFRQIGEVMGRSETWARVTFYRAKERLAGGIEHDE